MQKKNEIFRTSRPAHGLPGPPKVLGRARHTFFLKNLHFSKNNEGVSSKKCYPLPCYLAREARYKKSETTNLVLIFILFCFLHEKIWFFCREKSCSRSLGVFLPIYKNRCAIFIYVCVCAQVVACGQTILPQPPGYPATLLPCSGKQGSRPLLVPMAWKWVGSCVLVKL